MPSLADNPIFASAPKALQEKLFSQVESREYTAGQRILTEGESAVFVYALEAGSVRVFHASSDGAEVLLKLFRAPAVFGEAEALSHATWVQNVEAVEASRLALIPPAALLEFLQAHADSAVALLLDVARRLAIASENEKSLAFDPLTVRLADYLVDFATWTNADGEKEPTVRLTQDDMAHAMGSTRRAVAGVVLEWQKEGLLTRRGRDYVLRDVAKLREKGRPNRLALTYSLE